MDSSEENPSFDLEKQNLVESGQKGRCELVIPYPSDAKWRCKSIKRCKPVASPMNTTTVVILVVVLAVLLVGMITVSLVLEMNCNKSTANFVTENEETNEDNQNEHSMFKDMAKWVIPRDGNSRIKDQQKYGQTPKQGSDLKTEQFINDWKVLAAECGRPVVESPMNGSNIVGGDDVKDIRKWPWAAYIGNYFSSFVCGAELISSKWALTAAHCVSDSFGVYITLGTLRRDMSPSYSFETSAIPIVHPKYNDYSNDYDVALLKLERPVQISDYIRPVCLTTSTQETVTYRDRACWNIGWGHTSNYPYSTSSKILKEMKTTPISPKDCSNYYGSSIHNNMICSSTARGSGLCSGDSGGPMMCKNRDGAWDLVGTTSWGVNRCGDPYYPDVMARTSSVRGWIKETIDRNGGPGGKVDHS